jgi:hypothetical protein
MNTVQSIAPTTEIDAVNIMLGTIGESPVSSLAGDQSMVDVALARQVLREVATQVQEEGWHFNTEIRWPLQPTADTKEILLPANCIQVDTSGYDASLDVVARGNRLYDRLKRSYEFDRTVTVDMVVLLEFPLIPQAGRHYIAIRAARVFQQRMVGSETLAHFTERDELRARAALRKLDANTADYNILTGSWSVARVLAR